MTVIEYIQENPDCSREDISSHLEEAQLLSVMNYHGYCGMG